MKNTILRRGFFSRLTWGFFLVGLLFFTAPSYAEDPRVDSANPSSAEQGTYDLEVTVAGDNFGTDSEIAFFVTGTGDLEEPGDPGGITVKKVKRRGPKTLKVTIDVAPDAQTELGFDICVRSRGRTGKGTEMFRVMKKEKQPEPQWEVEIPWCGNSDLNLCGWNMTTYVETSDEDGVAVDVATGRDGETGLQVSEFTLVVFMCDWPDACFGSENNHQLTLQNFVFGDFEAHENLVPCRFPEGSMSECLVDGPPACMQCFINGEHPYSNIWPWPAGDGDDYTWIYFRVIAPGSFEDIQQGEEVPSSGRLEMMLRGQHNFLPTGNEAPHFVRAYADLPGDAVRISRVGDSWTVEVTVNYVTFFEGYRGCGRRRNPKGKCVGGWDYVYPLWADIAEPLHFTATWTRTYP